MSRLLDQAPFGPRDDELLLSEMVELTRHHLTGCPPFAAMWPDWRNAPNLNEIPFVHVGVFKRALLRTESPGVSHMRTLTSSGTSGTQSRIALDDESSALQARSSLLILTDLLGSSLRPLLVLDSVRSLRQRGEISAKIAAAMSLKPLASDILFLIDDPSDITKLNWEKAAEGAAQSESLLVYGLTSVLWQAWAEAQIPHAVLEILRSRQIFFVHSGGWKKLENAGISRETLSSSLLETAGPDSRVLDFYGLVEQVGLVFPLCSHGFRHAAVWSEVVVRDPYTLTPLDAEEGMLQFLNPLALGAPYHSVLTEDVGRRVEGDCPCGRRGRRFELIGRIPHAELRGCANV